MEEATDFEKDGLSELINFAIGYLIRYVLQVIQFNHATVALYCRMNDATCSIGMKGLSSLWLGCVP